MRINKKTLLNNGVPFVSLEDGPLTEGTARTGGEASSDGDAEGVFLILVYRQRRILANHHACCPLQREPEPDMCRHNCWMNITIMMNNGSVRTKASDWTAPVSHEWTRRMRFRFSLAPLIRNTSRSSTNPIAKATNAGIRASSTARCTEISVENGRAHNAPLFRR